MTEHDLAHKIEESIHNIFIENKNQPLNVQEIVLRVDKKLGNGEIDNELTKQIIEKMQDRFVLHELPSGKLALNQ